MTLACVDSPSSETESSIESLDDSKPFPKSKTVKKSCRSPRESGPLLRHFTAPPSITEIHDDRFADTIAFVLNERCKHNLIKSASELLDVPCPHDPAAMFFSPCRQNFTLNYYCKRLLKYSCCSKSCFVVAILYILRMADRYPVFELNDYNVHRLIFTSLVLAAKFMEDQSCSNLHYAQVGGIETIQEMNKLEALMLQALDYRLYVTKEGYEKAAGEIVMLSMRCCV